MVDNSIQPTTNYTEIPIQPQSKNLAVFVIIFLLLVTTIISGVYLFKYLQNTKNYKTLAPLSPSPIPSVKPIQYKTSNFENNLFSLNIPITWTIPKDSSNLVISPTFKIESITPQPIIPNYTLHEYSVDQDLNHSLVTPTDPDPVDPFIEEKYLTDTNQPILRTIHKAIFSDNPEQYVVIYRTTCQDQVITITSSIDKLNNLVDDLDKLVKSVVCLPK